MSLQLDLLIVQENTSSSRISDSSPVEDAPAAEQVLEPMEDDSLLIRTLPASSPTPEALVVGSAAESASAFSVPSGSPGKHIPNVEELTAELEKFQRNIGVQVDTMSDPFKREQLITISKITDENGLLVLTGVCSFELFYNITELYTEARTLQSTRSFCISDDDAVLLTFMKLYHDVTFSLLAVLFGVHRTTVSNIFKESIVILASILEHAVFWPDKDAIVSCLTTYFWDYKDTRMVLDCTEIEIERPKDLMSRLLTYSHYKRTYTAKVLVSETPGGLISYVSPAYGGKASDTFITKQSQLLDRCTPHVDSVMVDKGFLINELCREKNVRMIRPPFLMEKQLTTEEARSNQSIACARVHVERAIQRMKIYRILRNRFDLDLVPYIDKIFTVIAGMVNLLKPLFSEEKFLFK
uniref:Putative tick transposon n=1 Tax=Ixodes ricinus TaxID=34613 RepID=A0A147BIC1_IXORI